MEHIYHDREDGLAHCKVCNGGEGSLPSECPGTRMPADTEDAVYAGMLDYKNGAWRAGALQRAAAVGQFEGPVDWNIA